MEMLQAMKQCRIGGHVARAAYPHRKFFKDAAGIFPEAVRVDRIDFLSTDWEPHDPPVPVR